MNIKLIDVWNKTVKCSTVAYTFFTQATATGWLQIWKLMKNYILKMVGTGNLFRLYYVYLIY